jgi:hypothetical protein
MDRPADLREPTPEIAVVCSPGWIRTGAETVAVDAARFAGHVAGDLRHRLFVL